MIHRLLFALVVIGTYAVTADSARPHIIFIVADDLVNINIQTISYLNPIYTK